MRKLFLKLGVSDKHSFWALIKQFFKFGVVGVSNTAISLSIYYALLSIGVNYILANIISFGVSVLNAYYWNNRFVFKKENGGGPRRMARVYISYGITFLLSTTLLYLMVDVIKISKYIAPVLNLFITVPFNFLLNKIWVFH